MFWFPSVVLIVVFASQSECQTTVAPVNATVPTNSTGPTTVAVTTPTTAPTTTLSTTSIRLNTTVAASNTTITSTARPNATAPTTITTRKPANTTYPSYCGTSAALNLAGKCVTALTTISTSMQTMTNGNLMDAKSIATLNGFCTVFTTCVSTLGPCGNFQTSNDVTTVTEFCAFYNFFTNKQFLPCTKRMERVQAGKTPCLDSISASILDFNATKTVKCSVLTKMNSCAVVEVGKTCTQIAKQSYQTFVNQHIQEWMC